MLGGISLSRSCSKMSRSIIIQLCTLLCLLASLAAEPRCDDGPFKEHPKACVFLSKRWYQLQHEYRSRNCSHLKQGHPLYYACMSRIGKKATQELISEIESGQLKLTFKVKAEKPQKEEKEEKATRKFYAGGSLTSQPQRNLAGDAIPRKSYTTSNENKEISLFDSFLSAIKFW